MSCSDVKIITTTMKKLIYLVAFILLVVRCTDHQMEVGQTEITKWQYGKKGAVSITYDDGSINQFQKALPVMNSLKLPGTFFINTGSISGSQYKGRFIGRPVKSIIAETKNTPTNKDNFFERASAAGFLGLRGTSEYHTKAGAAFDAGRSDEAFKIIDELYKRVRNNEFQAEIIRNNPESASEGVNWDDIRIYANQGHEFASHMVTHPYMAALDEPNMLYELEKSRDEIQDKLGAEYTFSAECPYGTENERVMEYARKVYPALRNRMPEVYLEELNRSSKLNPGSFEKEYVQWQRGATTKTPLPMMKSWIDTTSVNDNIWLVLVFHGIEGVGWEALPIEMVDEYFRYIKSKENDLWFATFADVTRYMRQRMNSTIGTSTTGGKITINLTHTLDETLYNIPLTLKTYVSPKWDEVDINQGDKNYRMRPQKDITGSYVIYQVVPDGTAIILSEL
jgi:peptidoglycan/xylan/chitin deacetylase (PgdA/CDA1 family)